MMSRQAGRGRQAGCLLRVRHQGALRALLVHRGRANAGVPRRSPWARITADADMLQELQNLLASIYDVPLAHGVDEYLLTDRSCLPQALREARTDEEVLVTQEGDTVWVSVYLDPSVLERLAAANPFDALHGGNIADYWTALEGVSHFLYLAWNAAHDRPVTLLELELQAEIDKYITSLWLLRSQNPGRFPVELYHLLFERTRVDPALAGERAEMYRHASDYAARFCRRLARMLDAGSASVQASAVSELRRFYRLDRERKLHHIRSTAA